jgi:hypothetical protein
MLVWIPKRLALATALRAPTPAFLPLAKTAPAQLSCCNLYFRQVSSHSTTSSRLTSPSLHIKKEPQIQTRRKPSHQILPQVRHLCHCALRASGRVPRVRRLIRVSRSHLSQTPNTSTFSKNAVLQCLPGRCGLYACQCPGRWS